jgi:hypothetical protein
LSINITVGGCRDFNDYGYIFGCLDQYLQKLDDNDITFISGRCSGVDTAAERYAEEKGFKTLLFPAEWDKYGKAAGPIRNKKMVEAADIVIAFWDGRSRGTRSLIEFARKANKRLIIFSI